MIISWSAVVFSNTLINFFIKYMPGDIYINMMLSGLAAFSLLVEAEILNYVDIKKLQIFSLGIIFACGAALTLFKKNTSYEMLFASILLIAKVGANMTFGCVYSIHIELFPSAFITNSFGLCNFFARSIAILAP